MDLWTPCGGAPIFAESFRSGCRCTRCESPRPALSFSDPERIFHVARQPLSDLSPPARHDPGGAFCWRRGEGRRPMDRSAGQGEHSGDERGRDKTGRDSCENRRAEGLVPFRSPAGSTRGQGSPGAGSNGHDPRPADPASTGGSVAEGREPTEPAGRGPDDAATKDGQGDETEPEPGLWVHRT